MIAKIKITTAEINALIAAAVAAALAEATVSLVEVAGYEVTEPNFVSLTETLSIEVV
jgi:hypothetical protein